MRKHGFTLIELLIVIAIIAILALIAIPNFLEAQVRAKVSRSLADLRAIATAVEAYAVDYNKTPPVAPRHGNRVYRYAYLLVNEANLTGIAPNYCTPLTTPVSYITSLPLDPFSPREMTVGGTSTYRMKQTVGYGMISLLGLGTDEDLRSDPTFNTSVNVRKMDTARSCRIYVGAPPPNTGNGHYVTSSYVLVGAGPDREYNYRGANFDGTRTDTNAFTTFLGFFQNSAFEAFTGITPNGAFGGPNLPGMGTVLYDPTNGSISYGDIIRLAGAGN